MLTKPLPAPGRQSGFTLIELLIGITILSIAMALGIPSMSEWIQNAQIRTAAESITAGMQSARTEAVRRNTPIEFVLTGSGGIGETGWEIRIRNNPDEKLQSQAAGEGSRHAQLTPSPGAATTLTFSGLGRPLGINNDGSDPLERIDIDNPKMDAAKSRDLRIQISEGGEIRMCDPNVADTEDPRSC